MKTIVLVLLMFPAIGFGQKDSSIRFSEIVVVNSTSKDQLFQRARAWFNDEFKSSKDVLQIQDKETGEIAGKGTIPATITFKMLGTRSYPTSCTFSLKIYVKDGRYKYEVADFNNERLGENSSGLGIITSSDECQMKYPGISQSKMNDMWRSLKTSLVPNVDGMLTSLKTAMNKPSTSDF